MIRPLLHRVPALPAQSAGGERASGAAAGRTGARLRHLDSCRRILDRAAAIVSRGWVQEAFYVVRTPDGRAHAVGPLNPHVPRRSDVAAACLVGAVVHAGRTVPEIRDTDHLLALHLTWQALREVRTGVAAPTDYTALSPMERLIEVRDLTRWNDAPERTRTDVVNVLDVAVSRTILAAVSIPAAPIR